MDKNLINIDDLVRQRLGGGEEQEQAGSWGRMRDLLDKEMPQRPAGMYWRRSLSAVALLLLIAGVSIGGYQVYLKNAMNETTNSIAAATATNNDAVNTPTDNADGSANATASTDNSQPADNGNVPTDNNKNTGGNNPTENNQVTNNNNKLSTAETKDVQNSVATVAAVKTTNDNGRSNVSGNGKTQKNAKSEQLIAANNKHIAGKEANSNTLAADRTPGNNNAKQGDINNGIVAANGENSHGKTEAVKSDVTGKNSVASDDKIVAGKSELSADNTTKGSRTTTEGKETVAKNDAGSSDKKGTGNTAVAAKDKAKNSKRASVNKNEIAAAEQKKKDSKAGIAGISGTAIAVNEDGKESGNISTAKNKSDLAKGTATTGKKQTRSGSAIAKNDKGSAKNDHAGDSKNPTDGSVTDKKIARTGKAAKKAAKNNGATTSGDDAEKTMEELALSSSTLGTPGAGATSSTPGKPVAHKRTKGSKPSVGAQSPAAKKGTGVAVADNGTGNTADVDNAMDAQKADADKLATTSKSNKTKSNKTGTAQNPASTPATKNYASGSVANKLVAVKKPAAKQTTVAPVAAVTSSSTTGNENAKGKVVKSARKAQRQVQHLTLAQRYVKTSDNQWKYRLDTVSMETVTEDYDVAMNEANTIPFGPQPYDAFDYGSSDVTTVATVTKENTHVKKTKGTSSMENLSAAFNDMKNKVKGTHFAPGITAGINGTFFGPNSFKGLQFGFTGTFTFSETLSIMGELKYFHRINNNYTLNDNYYAYTPAAGGGYTKELIVNPYSFSTLHSFEMPVAIRYSISNFNFFAGANVVYSMSINAGAYPLKDPNSTTQVAAMENDNTPKIKEEDFSSRFGFGYLVGASYKVTPNLTLDFRNVQTMWDNGKSSGAKIISGQLYKSPSLQFSIGYRLGGRAEKDKE